MGRNKFIFLLYGILFLSCDFSTSEFNKKKITHNEVSLAENTSIDSISIDSMHKIAKKNWKNGDYQTSFNWINKAYRNAIKYNHQDSLAIVLNTLGLVQWRLGNNEDAMNSYIYSGEIAERLKMKKLLGLTHTNRGLIYKEQYNFESAFLHNKKAILLFKEEKDYKNLAIAYNNHGQIFKNKNEFDSAKAYYLKALKYYKIADYKDGEAATYYNLSDIQYKDNHYKEALSTINKSLLLSYEIDSKIRISEAYMKFSEIYEALNQPDSALKYYKLYNHENSNILIRNQSKKLTEYQAKMGLKIKSLQIKNLKKEQQIAKDKYWFIVIFITAIFLFIFSLIYRRFQKIRYNEKTLQYKLNNSQKILFIKERELKNYILDLSKKNEIIESLQKQVNIIHSSIEQQPEIDKLLESRILTNEDWNIFKKKFQDIYPYFFPRIRKLNFRLTEGEIRYLVLIHLKLNSKEMSQTLGISPQSARVGKMRLKKKIVNHNFKNIETFLNILMD